MESDEDNAARLTRIANILFYVMIAIQVVAIVLAFVMMVGLLIPLLIQLKDGSFYQSTRSRHTGKNPPYSTYNLYLVYLGLLDFIYLVLQITLASRAHDSLTWYNMPLWYLSSYPYVFANMWINAVVLYEVFCLLRASKKARRVTQPSLTRVNLQVGGIIVAAVPYELLYVYGEHIIAKLSRGLHSAIIWLMILPPTLYVIGMSIFVKCKGYIPPSDGKTPRDKAVRGLALYFLRVTLVFLVIWVPAGVLANCGGIYFEYRVVFGTVTQYFLAAQAILTFCLILSKPDVKKYIIDFVTLTYVFGDSNCCSRYQSNMAPSTHTNQEEATQRTRRTSILGYTFTEIDSTSIDPHSGDEEEVGTNEDNSQTISNAIASNTDDNDRDRTNNAGFDMENGIPQ